VIIACTNVTAQRILEHSVSEFPVHLRRLSSIKTASEEFPAHFFNDFDTAPAVLCDVTRGFVFQRIEMQLTNFSTFVGALVRNLMQENPPYPGDPF